MRGRLHLRWLERVAADHCAAHTVPLWPVSTHIHSQLSVDHSLICWS